MKILVCGAFDFVNNASGGQPVKTREFYRLLSDQYGKENVFPIETLGWKRNPIKLIGKIFAAAKKCDTMIMLPAHNGIEIFGRILVGYKKRKNKKIYYNVIGGWLAEKLENELKLKKVLREFDGIWVETMTMKNKLEKLGLSNITVVPNFKRLSPLSPEELICKAEPPLALCTFSRVMKEKGIEDAVKAVKSVNDKLGKAVFTLDIYGHIDAAQTEWFEKLKATLPEYVCYKGVADPGESVSVLKRYFALLFPTYYEGEGFAGTIIDAFAAGVPVIASDWKYNSEIVEEDITGKIFQAKNIEGLICLLEQIAQDPQKIIALKKNCIKKAKQYTPQAVAQILSEILN